jgi:hypothetical protein
MVQILGPSPLLSQANAILTRYRFAFFVFWQRNLRRVMWRFVTNAECREAVMNINLGFVELISVAVTAIPLHSKKTSNRV